MDNYYVQLHYWLSGHVPRYTLTLVQTSFLLLACTCTCKRHTYPASHYAFTIPTSPGTQGQVENSQEGQHQFDVLPATASIP